MKWFVDPLKKYADFLGRARRQEYWMWQLANVCIFAFVMVIDFLIGTAWLHSTDLYSSGLAPSPIHSFYIATVLYFLAVAIPSLAITVRRLHDTGRSGFWIFIQVIPYLGPLILFVFLVLDSDPFPNKYGPSPKYCEDDLAA